MISALVILIFHTTVWNLSVCCVRLFSKIKHFCVCSSIICNSTRHKRCINERGKRFTKTRYTSFLFRCARVSAWSHISIHNYDLWKEWILSALSIRGTSIKYTTTYAIPSQIANNNLNQPPSNLQWPNNIVSLTYLGTIGSNNSHGWSTDISSSHTADVKIKVTHYCCWCSSKKRGKKCVESVAGGLIQLFGTKNNEVDCCLALCDLICGPECTESW